jgi:predicted Zn-dependent protease
MRPIRSIAVLLAAAVAGCTAAQLEETRSAVATGETAIAEVVISDEEESQLGLQVQGELEKQGVKYSTDARVNDYVKGLVAKIAPLAQKDRKVEFTVHVIDDPKTVNAFATPGGYVNVYTGLLMTADNEAEIVGVLGHELGHVVARHSARQMVNQYGLQTVSNLAFGKEPTLLEQIATGIVGNGTMLAHSRSDENEADAYAVKYSSALGYDPHGIGTFFQKLLAQQGSSNQLMTYLSTHPATEDRIAHVNGLIAQQGLGGTDLGADRLAPIKQRLGAVASQPAAAPPANGRGTPGPAAPAPAPAAAPASAPPAQTPAQKARHPAN